MKQHIFLLIGATMLLTLTIYAVILRGDEAIKGIAGHSDQREESPSFSTQNITSSSTTSALRLGIYTYNDKKPLEEDFFAVEHIFIDWNTYTDGSIVNALTETISRDRWPLITVEPFIALHHATDTPLYDLINQGFYDTTIETLCTDIGKVEHPVFIRFMHEMDHDANAKRYPWAMGDPEDFIKSYRRFVEICDTKIIETYYVWSPVGSRNLDAYYPGNEYVDSVGLSLYSYPAWELEVYGSVLTFDELFMEKYSRVEKYDKKILLAEFGIAQSGNHQENFLVDMRNSLHKYPLLDLLIYFNAREPYPEGWGLSSDIDWTLEDITKLLLIHNPL